MVRGTFSPARAWRLAVGPASTRTLGVMNPTAAAHYLIWTHLTNAAALALHIGFLLQVVNAKSVATLIFTLVVAVPPLIISAAAILLNRAGAPRAFAQTNAAIYLIFGSWAYYDAIYVHPDPQNGLVFIFVPLLGVAASGIGAAIIFAVFQTRQTGTAKENDA